MNEFSKLPNIGPVVAAQMEAAGIMSFEQLKEMGAKQAWLKIREIDSSACIHRLFALEGAIEGIKKSQLPDNVKAELKEFYNSVKA